MHTIFTQTLQFLKKKEIKPLVDVALFIIITYSLHWLWWNFFWKYGKNDGIFSFLPQIGAWLAHQVFLHSSAILDFIGYKHLAYDNIIRFPNVGAVEVLPSCSGLKQFYQILFLFLLFPGPWKHKAWYIPAALLVMYFVNVMRIVILSMVLFPWPEHWDFIHLWILRPGFYVVIFGQWVLWNEKFRR